MELRAVIIRAAVTVVLALGLFWGIWYAGSIAFDWGGEVPPVEGRGVPTTVETTGPG
jgi:hypothetical protein